MHRLYLAGLNHTTAPLAMREKICFPGDQRNRALAALLERFPGAEAVLLSTCNRVELYVGRGVHGHPRQDEMIEFLAAFHALPVADINPHFYRKSDREAVLHLFSVASSLDSMVLGETQILGQVRDAYELAKKANATGALLNPLFQRAIAVGKQVLTQTGLGEGHVSIASAAVDYACQIFDRFTDKTVLSIGAGKMATLVLQSFSLLKPGRLVICNRDPAKASALAERFGGTPVPFERLDDHLAAADVVISSTGAIDPIIRAARFEQVMRQRRYRRVFLIDIALPRDIEAGVGELENVYLYNIDDLQKVVATTQTHRATRVDDARHIVEQQVEEFASWHRIREMGPMIERLYRQSQEMALEEVARTLNKLGDVPPEERAHLEDLARRIVNKLLHTPVHTLRHTNPPHGSGLQYLHMVERLFGLGKNDTGGNGHGHTPPAPQESEHREPHPEHQVEPHPRPE